MYYIPIPTYVPAITDGVPALGCKVLDIGSVMATVYGSRMVDDSVQFIADTPTTQVLNYA